MRTLDDVEGQDLAGAHFRRVRMMQLGGVGFSGRDGRSQ